MTGQVWRPQGDSIDGLYLLNTREIRRKSRLNLGVLIEVRPLNFLTCNFHQGEWPFAEFVLLHISVPG